MKTGDVLSVIEGPAASSRVRSVPLCIISACIVAGAVCALFPAGAAIALSAARLPRQSKTQRLLGPTIAAAAACNCLVAEQDFARGSGTRSLSRRTLKDWRVGIRDRGRIECIMRRQVELFQGRFGKCEGKGVDLILGTSVLSMTEDFVDPIAEGLYFGICRGVRVCLKLGDLEFGASDIEGLTSWN